MELDRAVRSPAQAQGEWNDELAEAAAATPGERRPKAMRAVELHPADCAWLHAVLARCCPEPAEREDLLQEVLIRLSRNADAAALAARHRPWLRSVALNCWRDHVRRTRRLPACEAGEEVFEAVEGREPVPGDLPEELHWTFEGLRVAQSTASRAVHRALRQLCPADRHALLSHYGLVDVADQLGEAAAARPRLHRARARLVARLRSALLVERAAEGR